MPRLSASELSAPALKGRVLAWCRIVRALFGLVEFAIVLGVLYLVYSAAASSSRGGAASFFRPSRRPRNGLSPQRRRRVIRHGALDMAQRFR